MKKLYRVNWCVGANQRSHFIIVETVFQTVDAFATALNGRFVSVDELWFNRDNPRAWVVTGRKRIALQGADIASIEEVSPQMASSVRQAKAG